MDTLKFQDIENLISQFNQVSSPKAIISDSETTVAAISALLQALNSHHTSVCKAVVEALVKLAPATVVPLISTYRNSTDQGLQAYIIQALSQIGDLRATDLLASVVGTEVANHCQGNVRRIAARGLGQICCTTRNPEVIHRAIEKLTWAMLTPEDWGLRYAAVVSLQQIATPRADAALLLALNQESDKVVRSRIRVALRR